MATIAGYLTVAAGLNGAESYAYWLRLLNITVTPLSDQEVALITEEAVRSKRRIVVANHNLHSVYLILRDRGMRLFYDIASYVHIDGMPLILLANVLGVRLKRIHRATSLDFMPLLLPTVVKEGWRVFYLGGRPEVVDAGARALCHEYPGLKIRTHHGFLTAEDNQAVLHEINRYQPHILMVGMGMPLQEKWIWDNRLKVKANVIFPVGAYMDYQAAAIPMAPRWLGALCLEWMYRLLSEPRRLWHRYLIEPWSVAAGLLCYWWTHGRSMTEIGHLRSINNTQAEIEPHLDVERESSDTADSATITLAEEPVEI